nr:1731_t:CDS:2 [Entrophospora candida]
MSDEVNEGNQADEYDELERTLEENSERRTELIKEVDTAPYFLKSRVAK